MDGEKKGRVRYDEGVINSAGTEIVLSLWEAPDPLAVVVFSPATMVHPLFYTPLLEGLAGTGFNVVGVHPVGHGKSPRDKKRYTLRDLVENSQDAVTFAIERYGLPVIAAGSSQGGVVTAALAATDGRLAAAFPHNMLLAELPDSIGISRFPRWMGGVYRPAQGLFRFFATLFPDLELPLGFYLDRKRISGDPAVWEKVENDELCLSRYSLHFLASLFTTVFPGISDGSIRCPVYVVADQGDRLFTAEYTRKVFDRLRAPYKEMVVFNFNDHMLMVTHPEEVCQRLGGKMREALERRGPVR
ncbi:MAG: lysophospholipase [Treponema sp.]|jgi:pimeloyl-ACP methyl ester carboxylesterase|nr:lysophospholipase [Treponema sp.]